MKFFAMMLLAGLLAGCAPKSVPLTEESANECERLVRMTERLYPEKTTDEALAAVQELFRLVDGGYALTSTPDGLVATRNRRIVDGSEPSFEGEELWRITVEEGEICTGGPTVGFIEKVDNNPAGEARGWANDCGKVVRGARVRAYLLPSVFEQGIVPSECFARPVFSPGVSKFVTAPAVYKLFFLRLDYLLGVSGEWTDCPGYAEYIRTNIHHRDQFSVINFQGHLDALCSQVGDRSPAR
jgi:hypothetical protein